MKLADFLTSTDATIASFARDIGIPRQTVHRYARGERTPRASHMAKIIAATEGKVTANDFHQDALARSRGAA